MLFIKQLRKKRHIYIKSSSITSILIICIPHMIFKNDEHLEGFLLLLNKNMSIPYISHDINIENYIENNMKLKNIKLFITANREINNKIYKIYYISSNTRGEYNSIYDNKITDFIWKDHYFLKACSYDLSDVIKYKINDFIINDYEIFHTLKSLLFNI